MSLLIDRNKNFDSNAFIMRQLEYEHQETV